MKNRILIVAVMVGVLLCGGFAKAQFDPYPGYSFEDEKYPAYNAYRAERAYPGIPFTTLSGVGIAAPVYGRPVNSYPYPSCRLQWVTIRRWTACGWVSTRALVYIRTY
jgi:hypothetical protein